jgi:PDZ domain-containing protein
VITAVDGRRVGTDSDLIAAIADERPLQLRVRREGVEVTAVVTPQLREVDDERRPMLGVRITTHQPRLQIPLGIDVTSGRVGGPSAGLMIALAVFDLVDGGDLAGGRRIAGTGTLALDGTVGTISGIELKVPAAAGAGADVFVAPAAQVAAARDAVPSGSNLAVLGVETFDDAVAVLTGGDTAADVAAAQPCRYQPDA